MGWEVQGSVDTVLRVWNLHRGMDFHSISIDVYALQLFVVNQLHAQIELCLSFSGSTTDVPWKMFTVHILLVPGGCLGHEYHKAIEWKAAIGKPSFKALQLTKEFMEMSQAQTLKFRKDLKEPRFASVGCNIAP